MKNLKNKITHFQKTVYVACRKIPSGRVSTYREIARAIGKPKSARAVGNALNKNPFSPQTPCHRVVRSDGAVGGFAFGNRRKIELLKKEGVVVKKGKVIDFEKKNLAGIIPPLFCEKAIFWL
jgi:O-6-methylguanine DNA methyltransferase